MGNGCLCADENCRGEVREGFTEDMELEQDLQAGVELGKVQGRWRGWHLREAVLSGGSEGWTSVASFR